MEQQDFIDITMVGGIALITFNVPSIVDVASVESISKKLHSLIDGTDALKVVVDFDGVKFFSSMILGMLVDIWRRLGETGGTVVISGIDPQLSRVFKITNLNKLFKFYPDRQSAVDAINEL
jgi:anti-sigma B factor antagonist